MSEVTGRKEVTEAVLIAFLSAVVVKVVEIAANEWQKRQEKKTDKEQEDKPL